MRRSILFILTLSLSLFAMNYTPKIVINDQIDCSSLEAITAAIIKPGMSDREKAEAVWRFIMSKSYHYKAPEEGLPDNGVPFEFNTLQDPLKLLNSYGYMYCYVFVGVTTTLWNMAGLDSTRIWGMPGHVISEVFYDKGWHYYDADQSVAAAFIMKDGKTVAGVEDLQKDPDFFILNNPNRSNPSMPFNDHPVYEHESRKVLADIFRQKDKHNVRDRVARATHCMDYYLRKNESLTLFFDPQGKWRHCGMDAPAINPANGPFDAHSDAKYANGLFEYSPDLRDAGTISEGFYSATNIQLRDGALTLTDPAKLGEAVIKVLSPYIITGTPLSPSFAADRNQKYTGAAVFSGRLFSAKTSMADPQDFEVRISTDKMTGAFEKVYAQANGGYFTLDLSPWLSLPTYYYLVKIILKKSATPDAETPRLDRLSLKTWVQVNPKALPALVPGQNKIAYSAAGPAVDKIDVDRCINDDRAKDYVHSMKNALFTKDARKRFVQADASKPGEVIVEISSLEGPITDWYFSLVNHNRPNEGMRTAVFYAENAPADWKDAGKKPKIYSDHWIEPFAFKQTASAGVRKVYVKVVLEGGAALCTFNYGYRYAHKPAKGSVGVVQAAEVDGKLKEFAWDFEGPQGRKIIEVRGKQVRNRYIKFVGK